MKISKVFSLLILLSLTACFSKKIKEEDTKLENADTISATEAIGKNADGDIVYQKKAILVNEIVKLEDEVTQLQDDVYGTPDYNSKGLYGKALACRKKKAIKTGEFGKVPEKSPILEDDKTRLVQDAQTKKLLALTEEDLYKRFDRFKEYKLKLFNSREEIEKYIDQCEAELK